MLMNLYGYNKEYYATLSNDIMQDYWHILILPQGDRTECSPETGNVNRSVSVKRHFAMIKEEKHLKKLCLIHVLKTRYKKTFSYFILIKLLYKSSFNT